MILPRALFLGRTIEWIPRPACFKGSVRPRILKRNGSGDIVQPLDERLAPVLAIIVIGHHIAARASEGGVVGLISSLQISNVAHRYAMISPPISESSLLRPRIMDQESVSAAADKLAHPYPAGTTLLTRRLS
jgi:hypothetical protein